MEIDFERIEKVTAARREVGFGGGGFGWGGAADQAAAAQAIKRRVAGRVRWQPSPEARLCKRPSKQKRPPTN
jgi:hypothetical protein